MDIERQIVTLPRSHPEFNSYLHGTFSTQHRALPIRSLNVGSPREEVTFRVSQISKIEPPPFITKWATAFRIRQIFTNLFPLGLAWLHLLLTDQSISPILALSVLFAVASLHGAIHLFNEYYDHLHGWDRVSVYSGTQVIQRGWVTAHQIRRLGLVFLGLALLSAIPIFLAQPLNTLLWGSLGLSAVILVTLTYWKHPGLIELATFLLLGPALLLGFSSVVAYSANHGLLALSVYCGGASAWNYYLKNVQNMMSDWQRKHSSLPLFLGYDKSKQWGWFFLIINGASLITFSSYHSGWLFWATLIMALGWLFIQLKMLRQLSQIPSCLSSLWTKLRKQNQLIHEVILLALFLIYLIRLVG